MPWSSTPEANVPGAQIRVPEHPPDPRDHGPRAARHPDAGHDPCFVSVREDRDPGAHDSSATSGEDDPRRVPEVPHLRHGLWPRKQPFSRSITTPSSRPASAGSDSSSRSTGKRAMPRRILHVLEAPPRSRARGSGGGPERPPEDSGRATSSGLGRSQQDHVARQDVGREQVVDPDGWSSVWSRRRPRAREARADRRGCVRSARAATTERPPRQQAPRRRPSPGPGARPRRRRPRPRRRGSRRGPRILAPRPGGRSRVRARRVPRLRG